MSARAAASGRRGPQPKAGPGDGSGATSTRSGGTAGGRRTDWELVLDAGDTSLLDIVDNVLAKGVVLTGDVTLALAQVDLVYLRLSLLLCAADRVLPAEDADFTARHHRRHLQRRAARKRT